MQQSPIAKTLPAAPVANAPLADTLAGTAAAGIGTAAGTTGALAGQLANPVNALVGASLLTELVRNLPQLVGGLAALKSMQQPVQSFPSAALPPSPIADIGKLPPELIQQVLAGGNVPGKFFPYIDRRILI